MVRSLHLMNKKNKGFSLLEVAVALLILSTTVIVIFQFIVTTQYSATDIEKRLIAREISNNRIALMETMQPPMLMGIRKGNIKMYGREWIWEEQTKSASRDLTQFILTIKDRNTNEVIFIREGYIEKK